jgi:hypothetical protein
MRRIVMTKTKRQFDLMEFMGNACMVVLAGALIYGLVANVFFLTDDALRGEIREDRRLLRPV